MCLLILIRGADPAFPLIVASNRDEHRSRKASPPGLYIGDRHRMLLPRDRRAGGTWMAVNQLGMFAGLTNIAGEAVRYVPSTRGELPQLALDQSSVAAAVAAVQRRCESEPFQSFQLIVASAEEAAVVVHRQGALEVLPVPEDFAVLTNEHRLGELRIPAQPQLAEPGLDLAERFERLKPVLVDRGAMTGHRILKKGGMYGTVSSALIAVPADDILRLQWWFAAGEPDTHPYRNYGNLAKRLL